MKLEDIIKQIVDRTGLSKASILEKIDLKCKELSGLITKEGAAYIVAKELGVEIPSIREYDLKIKNIVPGMRNVNVVGRVIRISPVNEFERANGRKGRVLNIWIADSSDCIRLPLWDSQIEAAEEVKKGDVVQILNAMARENVFGDVELSLGKYGSIRVLKDFGDIEPSDKLEEKFFKSFHRTEIKNIGIGNFEILATIVHVFKGSFIFQENGVKSLVVSCIVDDTTSTLRAVFFRKIAEEVCGFTTNQLLELNEEERYKRIADSLLGKEIIIRGRVRKNKISGRLEIIAVEVEHLNLSKESKKLAEKIEMLLHNFTTQSGK